MKHENESNSHFEACQSIVKRWREANPKLAGTEKDCVKEAMADIQRLMGGKASIEVGRGTAVLLFKKEMHPSQEMFPGKKT